ncbi:MULTISPECIES: GDSL family lysophospholipase PlaA [Legionella]|uniref:Lysophospholipase n=1 Tax=Legionella septentrionalis TaxID=2498109 RepID=A0A3S0V6F4_9GAMM|nr:MULTISPECIES: SGNH/GDSL hydrolase family protein [Legionella]MCP0914078.1 SGNH/GDSL hydrolase family protein [Legionella sp. 27cVA30]RUQ90762.1 lysophospholipase [Legionella septentrionalis]RUQ99933.1 lysophospholipase [Legionella septentrionalis]RUR10223.1 lysophospholipase [Legionella septentrionalis]RUR15765.1 lysophospholipase [Legionella septentrionalis]
MKIIFSFFLLFASLVTFAAPINKIVSFGDSLSDNGNLYEYMKHQLPVSPPYFQGRFTNGPVWIELLTQAYYPNNPSEHLLDFAFGGAGVSEEDADDTLFTLKREVDSYLLAHHDKADENSLYVVWIGANNYLSIPDDAQKSLQEVTLGIRHDLERLLNKGAQNLLVVNLPDLGRTPMARELEAEQFLTDIARKHNEILGQMVVDLQAGYPDRRVLHLDVYEILGEVLQSPEEYGFSNITHTCYESLLELGSANPVLSMVAKINAGQGHDACKGYLFFDPVHPTGPAHKILAEKSKAFFDELGLEFQ